MRPHLLIEDAVAPAAEDACGVFAGAHVNAVSIRGDTRAVTRPSC